jgi:hypothetical protein
MDILCTGCGRQLTISENVQLAPGYKSYCRSCLSPSRRRFQYEPDVEARRKLKEKLKTFANLPFHEHKAEWFSLCADLGIDEVAVEKLVIVVKEGKWQDSSAPRLYLQTTVNRRFEADDAIRVGLFSEEDEFVTIEPTEGPPHQLSWYALGLRSGMVECGKA